MLSAVFSFFTGKVGPWILLGLSVALVVFLWRENVAKDATIAEKSNDLKNSNFQITTTNEKNGQLVGTITTLQLNQDEFKGFNAQLSQQVQAMGIQMSQLQSVTSVLAHQKINVDTILSKHVADLAGISKNPLDTGTYTIPAGQYSAGFSDAWAKIETTINLRRGLSPFLTNTTTDFVNQLIIAHETKRKRVWLFFHKTIGISTHITSPSPYFKLDTLEDYQLTNN
jgi:FtsZ-binding cell division protein ZapB